MKLPVVSVEREVCELAKVRQVTAMLLIFKHVCDAAKVVRRVRWWWCWARQDKFEPEGFIGKINRSTRRGLAAGRMQKREHALGMNVPNSEH